MAENNGAKIDLETGTLWLNGIEIRPGVTEDDIRKYGVSADIFKTKNGSTIILLDDPVCSNGVRGMVTITIAKRLKGGVEVKIHPIWDDNQFEGTLDASKQWMLGIIDRKYFHSFGDWLASAIFPWGYVGAMYLTNKDYPKYGGDVQITYKNAAKEEGK